MDAESFRPTGEISCIAIGRDFSLPLEMTKECFAPLPISRVKARLLFILQEAQQVSL
jgi:hypothetical protein